MATVDLHIPISEEAIRGLHVGDQVRLYGLMVTARDAAHKYIKDTFFQGPEMPESERAVHEQLKQLWAGGVMYHCGPVVSKDAAGRSISSPPAPPPASARSLTRRTSSAISGCAP